MSIPNFDRSTGYLPAGVHPATLEEVRQRFTSGPKRKTVFKGLAWVVERLRACGVTDIWLDGSFVTRKSRPSDADVIYDGRAPTVDVAQLRSSRLHDRAHIKESRLVDLLFMPGLEFKKGRAITILEFFQSDEAGNPKGIIKLVVDVNDPTRGGSGAQE